MPGEFSAHWPTPQGPCSLAIPDAASAVATVGVRHPCCPSKTDVASTEAPCQVPDSSLSAQHQPVPQLSSQVAPSTSLTTQKEHCFSEETQLNDS